ncbi:MAG: ATPase [Betaproteobacteria bacterium]|nr:ATPase [Betaproteobacteria bacterium]
MRRDRVAYDRYKLRRKLREPTRCRDCGAVYRDGRWMWALRGGPAYKVRCPACQRIRDSRAAGYVSLSGQYFAGHREEILRRVLRCEQAESAEHPLERIIAITPQGGGELVTTTGVHLARRIAHALQHAYKGALESRYHKGEKILRVHWNR